MLNILRNHNISMIGKQMNTLVLGIEHLSQINQCIFLLGVEIVR